MQYEERTRIATPEGVELELVLAGLASRFMAEAVDVVLILLLVLAATIAVALIAGGSAGLLLATIVVGGWLLLSVAYHVAFEVLAAGRTPGKRACGLRVVMEGGEAVGLRASAVRNLLRLLEGPTTFYVPAIASILATRRNQRLGDLAAGTLVIREPRPGAAAAGPRGRPAADRVRRACGPRSGTSRRSRRRSWPRCARSSTGASRSRRPPAAGSRASSPSGSAPRSPARRPASRRRRCSRASPPRSPPDPEYSRDHDEEAGPCQSSGAPRARSSWETPQAPPTGGACGPRSGFWRRFAALFIDGLILAVTASADPADSRPAPRSSSR